VIRKEGTMRQSNVASEAKRPTQGSSVSRRARPPAPVRPGLDGMFSHGHENGNQSFLTRVGHGTVQRKLRVGPANDPLEREADRAADAIVRASYGDGGGGVPSAMPGGMPTFDGTPAVGADIVQRKCAKCEEEEEVIRRFPRDSSAGAEMIGAETTESETALMPEPAPAPGLETPAPEAPVPAQEETPATTSAGPLLVDEAATDVGPNQMTKTAFLGALQPAVCAAVDQGLTGTGRTSDGCPHVAYWFGHLAGKDAAFIERGIQRFAPAARGARTASEYIPAVAARVLESTRIWAETGRVEGVPEELASTVAAGPPMEEAAAGGQRDAAIRFKARAGGAKAPGDPTSVRDALGQGRSLDGGVRARMESAYGMSFGDVRVHTDAASAQLSDRMNARAFTVGQHVAFGAGEFRPGTVVGDALIAHELAHVVQQRGAAPGSQAGTRVQNDAPFERDANVAAGAAVASLFGRPARGARGLAGQMLSNLRSGLSLQRCNKTPSGPATLSRQVTIQPKDDTCGGMQMAAIFSVDNATDSTNGFVVQKVDFNLSREACAGGRNDFAKTYWEAWEVRKGIVYIGTSKSRHDSDGRGDYFRIGSTPAHKGTNKLHGWGKYIDGYTEPNSWGRCTEAGSLPCTTDPPKGWSDAGSIHRYLEADFDCCPGGKGTTRFDHQR
jgi:hypothetical protein